MEEEDIIPVDQLAMDDAAVVSETDAAAFSHSSGDEDDGGGWLSTRWQHHQHHGAYCQPINEEGPDSSDCDDDADMKDAADPEDLYCNNLDDEDEAWVYKNLRSGLEETVYLLKQKGDVAKKNIDEQTDDTRNETDTHLAKKIKALPNKSSHEKADGNEEDNATSEATKPVDENLDNDMEGTSEEGKQYHPQNNPQLQKALLLKPRTSDAILSCPRCFNIVCMDCQQHEKYANQWRAMFVMNIGVDWNKTMIYDEHIGGLKLATASGERRTDNDTTMQEIDNANGGDTSGPDKIPHHDFEQHDDNDKGELYYSVQCSYCHWEVAALDMKDEIYHFYGCIPSA